MKKKFILATAFMFTTSFIATGFPQPARAAFPGANGKIIFRSNRDINTEIYSMNADGSGQINLTNNVANEFDGAYSPDGNKILFRSTRDAGNQEIYVMNADGSGQTRITNNVTSAEAHAVWSPDGSKIAFFSDRDGNGEIYVMNADGSGQINLTNNVAAENFPAWSPDGTKIIFNTNRDGNNEIYVMNADGSNQTRLTNNAFIDGSQFDAWSPDGTKITFNSSRDGNNEIYVMNADGSNQTRITTDLSSDSAPAWSPDGSKIGFTSNRDGNNEAYTMNIDGTNQARLTTNAASDLISDWQSLLYPIANDDSDITTTASQAVVIDVLANDTDTYGSVNPASVTITAASANGTTSINTTTGAITYTPNAGFIGNDAFTYQVCSSTNPTLCDTATVSLTVIATLPGLPKTGSASVSLPTLLIIGGVGLTVGGLWVVRKRLEHR